MSNNLGDGQRTDCTGIIYIYQKTCQVYSSSGNWYQKLYWLLVCFNIHKKTAVKPAKSEP